MYPPVFPIISIDSGVQDKLGYNPVRVFPFGGAPDQVALPYAVWQVVDGSPENYISNDPDMDRFLVQFDVYAETAKSAREAAEALRYPIQRHAHITAWRGETRDPEAQLYRFSFDVNFLTAR